MKRKPKLEARLGERIWTIRQAKRANSPQDFIGEDGIYRRAYPSGFVRRPYVKE